MTTLADRIPLDEITGQAREVRFGRAVLTLVAAVFFGLGWAAARCSAVAWLAVSWVFVAVREGWRASHGPSRASQLAQALAQAEHWREEARRLGG